MSTNERSLNTHPERIEGVSSVSIPRADDKATADGGRALQRKTATRYFEKSTYNHGQHSRPTLEFTRLTLHGPEDPKNVRRRSEGLVRRDATAQANPPGTRTISHQTELKFLLCSP